MIEQVKTVLILALLLGAENVADLLALLDHLLEYFFRLLSFDREIIADDLR